MVEEMTKQDGRAMLDAAAKEQFGIDREEFLWRLDSGEFDGMGAEGVVRLQMLAPFGR